MSAECYLDFGVVEADFRHLTRQMGDSIALTTLW
jgi:hypothetical protein